MHNALPWFVLLLGCMGNCGFWAFCLNRVNAVGIARPIAKLGEKLCMALCFLIPGILFWFKADVLKEWLDSNAFWPPESFGVFTLWLIGSLASLMVLGPLWIESRRWLIPPANLTETRSQHFDVHREVEGGSAGDFPTRVWRLVPQNDWAKLEVNHKQLRLTRKLPHAEGLTIGHLSDLHFTGQYRVEHYQYVVDRLMQANPELIVISGDIIDFQHCIPMIDSVLGRLDAPLGVHFVLGNHDRRLKDIQGLVDRLNRLGFHDLGVSDRKVQRGDLSIRLTGDERPWFERHVATEPHEGTADGLRIGVAHTPDRIGWARRLNLDLLLAGHTHGGQIRLPWIGPIVAPSLHGSKFASGVFLLPPTLMHVSRGVAGTHTLRWRCIPEVSVLKLTND